jgi:molybdopterin-binding protein
VFVALKLGEQQLWAEVTANAIEDLGLAAGSSVTCLIKSTALRVVD